MSDPAMTDHAELARLAEAATPGPWTYRDMTSNTYGPAFVDTPDVMSLAICGEAVGRSETHGFCLQVDSEVRMANAAFIAAANPATVLALIAEVAALRGERDAMTANYDRATRLHASTCRDLAEAERKLGEAVDDERSRSQAIINERDQWIVELIRERDAAKAILRDAVSEAVPDAMIFAGHPDAQRYSKALDGLRRWTDRARIFLSKEAERG